jgi:hypothetical protein
MEKRRGTKENVLTLIQSGRISLRMNTTTTQDIAQEIIDQLGGRKFTAMTGAKHFVSIESGLQFKLPSNFATAGINFVQVILGRDDLYTVKFYKMRGLKLTLISEHEGIYNDMLADLFTRNTGLSVSL